MGAVMDVPKFAYGTIEAIARAVGELYTGKQLTSLLAEAGVSKIDSEQSNTKWIRIAKSINEGQLSQDNGQPLIELVKVAFNPRNLSISNADSNIGTVRDTVNKNLSLDGFEVLDDGTVITVPKAATIDEAMQRSDQLREYLRRRGAHEEVLKHCRPELLRDDYYEATFESIKGLGDRLRKLTGEDLDGRELVQNVFGRKNLKVKLNEGKTQTERNEQEGTKLLAEGLFAAFRNPAAHETRLEWHISEQDALDIMGLVSLIHRRIDNAEVLQNENL
jgi:TIGR02391 family protein